MGLAGFHNSITNSIHDLYNFFKTDRRTEVVVAWRKRIVQVKEGKFHILLNSPLLTAVFLSVTQKDATMRNTKNSSIR